MHPIQGSLHIRKSGLQSADDTGIWSHAKTHAVHDAFMKRTFGLDMTKNIRPHSRNDVLEFAFPEVTDDPPYPRIDEREHLLANVSVSSFRRWSDLLPECRRGA